MNILNKRYRMKKEENGFGSIYQKSHFGYEEKKPGAIDKVKSSVSKAVGFIKTKINNK